MSRKENYKDFLPYLRKNSSQFRKYEKTHSREEVRALVREAKKRGRLPDKTPGKKSPKATAGRVTYLLNLMMSQRSADKRLKAQRAKDKVERAKDKKKKATSKKRAATRRKNIAAKEAEAKAEAKAKTKAEAKVKTKAEAKAKAKRRAKLEKDLKKSSEKIKKNPKSAAAKKRKAEKLRRKKAGIEKGKATRRAKKARAEQPFVDAREKARKLKIDKRAKNAAQRRAERRALGRSEQAPGSKPKPKPNKTPSDYYDPQKSNARQARKNLRGKRTQFKQEPTPKKGAPKMEAPKTKTPKTKTPKAKAPKVKTPKTKTPKKPTKSWLNKLKSVRKSSAKIAGRARAASNARKASRTSRVLKKTLPTVYNYGKTLKNAKNLKHAKNVKKGSGALGALGRKVNPVLIAADALNTFSDWNRDPDENPLERQGFIGEALFGKENAAVYDPDKDLFYGGIRDEDGNIIHGTTDGLNWDALKEGTDTWGEKGLFALNQVENLFKAPLAIGASVGKGLNLGIREGDWSASNFFDFAKPESWNITEQGGLQFDLRGNTQTDGYAEKGPAELPDDPEYAARVRDVYESGGYDKRSVEDQEEIKNYIIDHFGPEGLTTSPVSDRLRNLDNTAENRQKRIERVKGKLAGAGNVKAANNALKMARGMWAKDPDVNGKFDPNTPEGREFFNEALKLQEGGSGLLLGRNAYIPPKGFKQMTEMEGGMLYHPDFGKVRTSGSKKDRGHRTLRQARSDRWQNWAARERRKQTAAWLKSQGLDVSTEEGKQAAMAYTRARYQRAKENAALKNQSQGKGLSSLGRAFANSKRSAYAPDNAGRQQRNLERMAKNYRGRDTKKLRRAERLRRGGNLDRSFLAESDQNARIQQTRFDREMALAEARSGNSEAGERFRVQATINNNKRNQIIKALDVAKGDEVEAARLLGMTEDEFARVLGELFPVPEA